MTLHHPAARGLPVQALHPDSDVEEARAVQTQWREATGQDGLPPAILRLERGSAAGDEIVAYVRGALSLDRRLRVHVVTVNERSVPRGRMVTFLATSGIARPLRDAFQDERRVMLTDYCQDDDE